MYLLRYITPSVTRKAEKPIEKTILEKLLRHGYIGARHTSIDNLPKGFPKHLRKEVVKAAGELVKAGLLIAKPTSYGLEVSLNPKRLREIMESLRTRD